MHFGLNRLTSICTIEEKLEYGSTSVFGLEYEVSNQNYHIDWQDKLMPQGSEVINVGSYLLALKISSDE